MTSWIDSDRTLLGRLATATPEERIRLLTENVRSGESVLNGEFDTRSACDIMVRIAVSHLMLTKERTESADARSAALWAIRAGRRALGDDIDSVQIVPRALAVIAGVLRLLDDHIRNQAVSQIETLLDGYTDAVKRLHEGAARQPGLRRREP